MTRFRLVLVLLVAVLATACGSSPQVLTHPQPGPGRLAPQCQPGSSYMGCAMPRASLKPSLHVGTPAGAKFPDVSSYQGHPNWAAAKPHISMAVAKAFEFTEDPDFRYNADSFKRLGIRWAAYDFVRSCNASGFIAVLRSVGGPQLPPVLDMEVPAAGGCAVPMANQIWRAFHVWPIVYTGPGTYPGGANGNLRLWIADYGPSFPCMWTCHPVGWQFGAPPFVHYYIPGIGYGDVSVDYGFSKLLPKPLDVHHYAWFPNVRFSSRWGKLIERNVVVHYDGARQHPRKYGAYLKTLRAELNFLAHRVAYIALTQRVHGKPSWDRYHRGWRFQQLIKRAEGHRFA